MPELPEVETTRRGIEPHVKGRRVTAIVVREHRLREPVPADIGTAVAGRRLQAVERRAKYLLLRFDDHTIIVHLGMSGSLHIVTAHTMAARHDHLDIGFTGDRVLRFHDPRRFGIVTWTGADPLSHRLLRRLGPEPLDPGFDGRALHGPGRGRRATVKSLLLDGTVVAGVGNIYANEALHRAGIRPARAASRIALARYHVLAARLQEVLAEAIEAGGTTLRDFIGGDGKPGYFSQRLKVYGREGLACEGCGATIRRIIVAQRSSYFCPRCQR